MNLTDAQILAEIVPASLLPKLNAAFPHLRWELDLDTERVVASEVKADAGVWLGWMVQAGAAPNPDPGSPMPQAFAQASLARPAKVIHGFDEYFRPKVVTLVAPESPAAAFAVASGFDERTGEAVFEDDGA